jgi:hypothetical protein
MMVIMMMALAFSVITRLVANDTTGSTTKYGTDSCTASTTGCTTNCGPGACANQYAGNGFFLFGASGKRN